MVVIAAEFSKVISQDFSFVLICDDIRVIVMEDRNTVNASFFLYTLYFILDKFSVSFGINFTAKILPVFPLGGIDGFPGSRTRLFVVDEIGWELSFFELFQGVFLFTSKQCVLLFWQVLI